MLSAEKRALGQPAQRINLNYKFHRTIGPFFREGERGRGGTFKGEGGPSSVLICGPGREIVLVGFSSEEHINLIYLSFIWLSARRQTRQWRRHFWKSSFSRSFPPKINGYWNNQWRIRSRGFSRLNSLSLLYYISPSNSHIVYSLQNNHRPSYIYGSGDLIRKREFSLWPIRCNDPTSNHKYNSFRTRLVQTLC